MPRNWFRCSNSLSSSLTMRLTAKGDECLCPHIDKNRNLDCNKKKLKIVPQTLTPMLQITCWTPSEGLHKLSVPGILLQTFFPGNFNNNSISLPINVAIVSSGSDSSFQTKPLFGNDKTVEFMFTGINVLGPTQIHFSLSC